LQRKKQDKLMRVPATLGKDENSLSFQEIDFVQTCSQIRKVDSDEK
jgi:hypothetical protein